MYTNIAHSKRCSSQEPSHLFRRDDPFETSMSAQHFSVLAACILNTNVSKVMEKCRLKSMFGERPEVCDYLLIDFNKFFKAFTTPTQLLYALFFLRHILQRLLALLCSVLWRRRSKIMYGRRVQN